MKLNEIDTVALTALVKLLTTELDKRADLEPGTHNVDACVQMSIGGTVTKNENESYVPTVKIPHKAAMALLVHHCGITGDAGDAAIAALTKAMKAAMEDDEEEADDLLLQ